MGTIRFKRFLYFLKNYFFSFNPAPFRGHGKTGPGTGLPSPPFDPRPFSVEIPVQTGKNGSEAFQMGC